jgi:hypothetical protein
MTLVLSKGPVNLPGLGEAPAAPAAAVLTQVIHGNPSLALQPAGKTARGLCGTENRVRPIFAHPRAMQAVEGSNPFSRLIGRTLSVAFAS